MLSKKTKYALHALTYLGKQRQAKTVLIQDIAEEHGISHKFLENILLELRKAGYLGSKKGKGGGYYLKISRFPALSACLMVRSLCSPASVSTITNPVRSAELKPNAG
jgi:Rrf2 family protein